MTGKSSRRRITTNDLLALFGAGVVGLVFGLVDTWAQYGDSPVIHGVVTGSLVFTVAITFYRIGRNLER